MRAPRGLCFSKGVSAIADTATLAVSVLDLKLVQDVIGAIRAADAVTAAENNNPLTPLPTIESPRHIFPDPIYEHRRHIHPEPVYARRPIVHPAPYDQRPGRPRLALEPDRVHSAAPCNVSPIKPPLPALAARVPASSVVKMKRVVVRTDILSKGSLIDMFI